MNHYRLKACRRCGGDLVRDETDWICLQCGSYSYVGLYSEPVRPLAMFLESPENSKCRTPNLRQLRYGLTR